MNEILNKKVSRNFEVVKTYELGIKLLGEEVKALKYQGGTFTNSYIRILQGGLFLVNLNIPRYKKSSSTNYTPSRERKLLANKRELVEIKSNLSIKGRTVVPLKLYLNKNLYKLSVAVVKTLGKSGKKQKLKEEQIEKETRKEAANYNWEEKYNF